MAGSDWNLNSQTTVSSQTDLEETIKYSAHKNFSISIAYVTGVTDTYLTQEKYDYYCQLINNVTDVRVFKFKDEGFGKSAIYGGQEKEFLPNGNEISTTRLTYEPILSKNSYGYYEKRIDMDLLELKGSAEAVDPVETIFSGIIQHLNLTYSVNKEIMRLCYENETCLDNLASD